MKKIPDHAKKVFEGVIFDVYHWDQEMFDGTVSTHEAIKRKGSVTILSIVGDKISVNKEEQPGKEPFTTLPGGRIEEAENPIDAAKRELVEETGYSSDSWVEWFSKDAYTMAKFEWNNYYFIAKNCCKNQEPKLDPGEKIESYLVTLEQLIEIRNELGNRAYGITELLEKAANDEEEKQKLKELFGIKN